MEGRAEVFLGERRHDEGLMELLKEEFCAFLMLP